MELFEIQYIFTLICLHMKHTKTLGYLKGGRSECESKTDIHTVFCIASIKAVLFITAVVVTVPVIAQYISTISGRKVAAISSKGSGKVEAAVGVAVFT